MTLSQRIYPYLPEAWQDKLLAKVISSGQWKSIPTFQMLFKSFELLGGDHTDILEAFTTSRDMDLNFYENCRKIAQKRVNVVKDCIDDPVQARKEFQKALILYFLADWVSFTEDRITQNYRDLLAVSAQIDELGHPRTEKILLPWSKGQISARFRVPENVEPDEQLPIILILQGNDTVKEILLVLEEELLKSHCAVLNVDPPGWGESRLTGNFFEKEEDPGKLADVCFEFLKTQPNIDLNRIGLMGFSMGGTWVALLAGSRSYFKVMVAVGGAIYKLEESVKLLPAMQKRQTMKHLGCSKMEILKRIQDFNQEKLLHNIQISCLLIHGDQDTLVPVDLVRQASKIIAGPVDLRIVSHGDHMVTDTLMQVEVPFMQDWLKNHL